MKKILLSLLFVLLLQSTYANLSLFPIKAGITCGVVTEAYRNDKLFAQGLSVSLNKLYADISFSEKTAWSGTTSEGWTEFAYEYRVLAGNIGYNFHLDKWVLTPVVGINRSKQKEFLSSGWQTDFKSVISAGINVGFRVHKFIQLNAGLGLKEIAKIGITVCFDK